jgi:hypothetical protein
MKAGRNVWMNEAGETAKSAERHAETRESGMWFAHYAASRVRGSEYTPYDGSDVWTKDANRRMADRARGNFETRS